MTDDKPGAPPEPHAEQAEPREPRADRPLDDEAERSVRQRLEALIPDLVKRTVTAGLGAAFATEGGIRKLAGELTLPKEIAQTLLATADTTKDRVVEIIARETREFLQNLNLNDVLVKTLTQLSFEIRTEIRFVPNDQALGGVKPEVKQKVGVKRVKDTKDDAPLAAAPPEPAPPPVSHAPPPPPVAPPPRAPAPASTKPGPGHAGGGGDDDPSN